MKVKSKRRSRKPLDKRWCAPEHRKSGSSWKGDKIMTSNFVRTHKKKKEKKVQTDNKRVNPIVKRIPDYVLAFDKANGFNAPPYCDAKILYQKNTDTQFWGIVEKKPVGNFINDNHMNAVTMDGRKEYK